MQNDVNRRDILRWCMGGAALAAMRGGVRADESKRKPNIIVILCDDLGFGDIGAYGAHNIATPAIDKMAREGVTLTNFYSAANLCTPSRAGLLTGRYAIRSGLAYEVIMAEDTRGLPLSETTIANALKPEYATGLFGKWHLGHTDAYWPPTRHGFDRFFGIRYSHDMKPLELYEADGMGGAVKESAVDFPMLQQQFYAHAEKFIEDNRDRPFFCELALSAPHLPEYPHEPFKGTSGAGAYGDVVREIDSIVGRLLKKVQALGIDRDTLIVFTSDNGPWFEGSPGNFRERKGGGAYDGGYHVPFIARQPGFLPAGAVVDSIAMGIDLLPTFCHLSGKPLPQGVTLDGRDITTVLAAGTPSPHEQLVLFDNEDVVGIRTQDWKYVGSAYYRGFRLPFALLGYEELYDLRRDPGENYSVASDQPEILAQMRQRFEAARKEFMPLKSKDIPPVFLKMREQYRHMQD
ncbi:MAG: sulfatase [Steroidobacteraceae bacterium]